jgi:lipoate-protein ligase A
MILIDNRNATDPYLNLAIEEYAIRNITCTGEDYLLLYTNEPSIVLGKNQSIYKEVNFAYLRNGRLKLARRITGGGTVYHDAGNLNFSVITGFEESKVNNYRYFNQPVIDALGRAGVEAGLDARNNIICRGKKISGSAQFTNRKNIISHGTLLLNANLNMLRACLKQNHFKVESKAVSSVKSSVINLQQVTGKFASTDELKAFLAQQMNVRKHHNFTAEDWDEIEKLRHQKFSTFEWIYGRSPHTTIEKDGLVIDVTDGKITSVKSHLNMPYLIGTKYAYQSLQQKLLQQVNGSTLLQQLF